MTDETQHLEKAVSDPGLDPGFEKKLIQDIMGEDLVLCERVIF